MGIAELVHDTAVRVRYCEVDRMGYLHHGHYLAYFEHARTEWLRSVGTTYRDLEDQGTLLVVVETGQRHLLPAGYDDQVVVRTRLAQLGGVRLRFEYELRRDDTVLATGFTVLAACTAQGRPCRLPVGFRAVLDAALQSPGRKPTGATGVQDAPRGNP